MFSNGTHCKRCNENPLGRRPLSDEGMPLKSASDDACDHTISEIRVGRVGCIGVSDRSGHVMHLHRPFSSTSSCTVAWVFGVMDSPAALALFSIDAAGDLPELDMAWKLDAGHDEGSEG